MPVDGEPATPGSPSSAAFHAALGGLRVDRLPTDVPLRREPTLPPGALVDRHVLLAPLGQGGMGVVYAAYDPELDRKVAVKLLAPRRGGDAEADRLGLLREAQALARLTHPNVVTVYDVGTRGEQVWIAMEFVAGPTLAAWARAQPRPWPEVLHVLRQAARGVAAAHAAGLVHRDLKPDNVMIGADERVRVMDFGLAHGRAAPVDAADPRPSVPALAQQLTRAGALHGTPAYMAPEQWLGREAIAATDQFGWCVMAWELLYGERPFAADAVEVLAADVVAGRRWPPPRDRPVPRWLRRVLERGLAVDPARRWPTMTDLLAALERGRRRARAGRVLLALVVLVALAGLGLGLRRLAHERQLAACTAAGAEIDAVWNDAARSELRAAFLRTGVDHAATTAEKIVPWLDARAEAWRTARSSLCRAADVDRSWDTDLRDRGLWCLDDHRVALASLVAELRRADATAVHRAVASAASLSSAAHCVDPDRLARQPAVPLERRAAVRALRTALSQVDTLLATGRYADGLALATTTRAQAEALAWPPLLAEALAREAAALQKTGDPERAEAAGATAYFTAARVDAWEVATDAAIGQIERVGSHRARFAEGHAWARHAEVAGEHVVDREGLFAARRLHGVASVHEAAREFAAARALHEQALAGFERALGGDHPFVAGALNNLANTHFGADDFAGALAMYRRSLAIRERVLGPDHPDVGTSLNNIASAYMGLGAHAEAEAPLLRALAIRERALGPDHPDVAQSLNNLALLRYFAGDLAQVQATLERVVAIEERSLGPDHPGLAESLSNLANVHLERGDFAAARPLYARALTIQERVRGPAHPLVGNTLQALARVEIGEGRPAAAVPLLARAVEILLADPDSRSDAHDAQFALAQALAAAHGDPAEARRAALQARDGYRELAAAGSLAEVEAWLVTARSAAP